MYTENNDQVVYLYLDDIIPNRFQPRELFDEKALKELAVSIKEHGVIQPIIVRSVKGKYEIIAGERRYKASALAGLTKIPAIIRDLDDKESSKVALLENLQRKNLTPIEEARTYQKILEIDQMTQEELAKTMGKSQSAVANKLRLLSLPDEVQDAILKEQISERHARALLNIPNAQKQTEMLKKIISNKLSVRAVEEEIKELYKPEELNEDVGSMNDGNISLPNVVNIPSANSYIDNSPLMPTTAIPEEKPEIGTIKIVPPTESTGQQESQKFINYGDLDKEDDESIEPPMAFNNPNGVTNLDDLRNQAMDINIAKPKTTATQTADLDSLLNLQNMAAGPAVGYIAGENKFLTPAEKIVKTDEEQAKTKEEPADYFKSADFVPSIPEIAPTSYTSEQAMSKVRSVVNELKSAGVSISSSEMNFENSYQIIIKVDK